LDMKFETLVAELQGAFAAMAVSAPVAGTPP
jgi:hypothetical protein